MAYLRMWECDRCGRKEPEKVGLPRGWEYLSLQGRDIHQELHFCPVCWSRLGDPAEQFRQLFLQDKR